MKKNFKEIAKELSGLNKNINESLELSEVIASLEEMRRSIKTIIKPFVPEHILKQVLEEVDIAMQDIAEDN